ncbi:MAG: helix-turn-helix domain-containing protein [Candidatus Altiarchaeota archaeon]
MNDDPLAKQIAGEITLSENPPKTLRKWREIFGASQKDLARKIGVAPSVISDYEGGRRKNPGAEYIKKCVQALIKSDEKSGGEFAAKKTRQQQATAILALREFLEPIPAKKLAKKIMGKTVSGKPEGKIWGYTVVDSIQAILSLSDREFARIYGSNTERALIFTKVQSGRSPMIALKVTQPKPKLVVFHGPSPLRIDKLAKKIAEVSNIPLVVSTMKSEEKLIEELEELT